METNFDYLLEKSEYASFAEQAVEAEKSIAISPATCAILSRRALELAVRFVFSYDAELSLPYRDNVSSLIHEPTFRRIIEPRLFPMLKYTIHLGNVAVHTNNNIKRDEAVIALRDLFEFCDWIDYSYSKEYSEKSYDESVLANGDEKRVKADELRCQTAHCGRCKLHFDFGVIASPIVPYRNLPQAFSGITADCRSLV